MKGRVVCVPLGGYVPARRLGVSLVVVVTVIIHVLSYTRSQLREHQLIAVAQWTSESSYHHGIHLGKRTDRIFVLGFIRGPWGVTLKRHRHPGVACRR